MKYLFPLAVLLLTCGPAAAQAPRVAARPDSFAGSLAAAPAVPDTVAALHRLFAAKRTRSYIITGALVAGVLIGSLTSKEEGGGGSGSSFGGGGFSLSRSDDVKIYSLLAAPFLAGNLFRHVSYSKKREVRAQADFEAHRLSPNLKRKLKAKYFR